METAVARVAHTLRGLDGKEALALDRQIQRIAGLLQGPLGKAEPVPSQQPEIVHGPAELRIERVGPQQHRAEILPLRTISRCLRIGKIARSGVHCLRSRHQSCHRRVVTAVHGAKRCTRGAEAARTRLEKSWAEPGGDGQRRSEGLTSMAIPGESWANPNWGPYFRPSHTIITANRCSPKR